MRQAKNNTNLLSVYIFSSFLLLTSCSPLGPTKVSTPHAPTADQPHQSTANIDYTSYKSFEKGPADTGQFRSVAAADFNNDGCVDLAAGNSLPTTRNIYIWLGNGVGGWMELTRLFIKGDIRSLTTGDINNDGLTDIICSTWGDTNGIRVWLNQGENRWTHAIPPTEEDQYEGVVTADVNNDGNIDIIAANSTTDKRAGVQVWLGDGKGGWTKEIGPKASTVFRDVAVADFNNDGFKDIVATGWGTYGELRVWLGSGSENWTSLPPLEKGNFWGVVAGDFDQDGNDDIAYSAYEKGLRIRYGNGKGSFSEPMIISLQTLTQDIFFDVAKEDVDGNGYQDLIVSSYKKKGIQIWLNHQGRSWTKKNDWLPDFGTYYQLTAADFDKDEKIDIAAASFSEGVKVWTQSDKAVSDLTPVCVKKEKEKIEVLEIKPQEEVKEEPPKPETFSYIVYFDTGKNDLRPEMTLILDKVVEVMTKFPDTTARLEGHCDYRDIHTSQFPSNWELSDSRANRAFEYLVAKGIAVERLSTAGYGVTRPLTTSKDVPSLQLNRRAEIIISIVKKTEVKEVINEAFSEKPQKTISLQKGTEDTSLEALRDMGGNKVYSMLNGFPEYLIGPGDIVEISLWKGTEEERYRIKIRPDGKMSFTYLEDIYVSGLTPTQLDRFITDKLSGLVRQPRVDVRVEVYSSKYASIFGEIFSHFRQPTGPGTYPLTGKQYLMDFISLYGGPTANADLKDVEIVRGGKTYHVNLYRALFQGDLSQNIIVDDGDVIFIPSIKDVPNKVFVFGEVKTPGMYPFKSTINALEAISLAGGFTKDEALLSQTRIIRGDLSNPEIIPVDIKKLFTRGEQTQSIALQNNDIVYVPRTLIGDWNSFIRQLAPTIDLATRPFITYRLWQDIQGSN